MSHPVRTTSLEAGLSWADMDGWRRIHGLWPSAGNVKRWVVLNEPGSRGQARVIADNEDRLGWSLYIYNQLPERTAKHLVPAWKFALYRLSLERIDLHSWCCIDSPQLHHKQHE